MKEQGIRMERIKAVSILLYPPCGSKDEGARNKDRANGGTG
jgi:hypothetical protein